MEKEKCLIILTSKMSLYYQDSENEIDKKENACPRASVLFTVGISNPYAG